jgi:hypothetical protein
MALVSDPATTPNIPQVNGSSDAWDPATISNVVFSAVMVFIGIVAIWQAHRAHYRSRHALNMDGQQERPQVVPPLLIRGTEEEIIGIRVLSHASTMPANASPGLDPSLPSSQVALTALSIDSQEVTGTSTSPDRPDTHNDTPVAATTCL